MQSRITQNRKETTMTKSNDKKMPNWRLVQEKAYYKPDSQGRAVRCTDTIEIAVGWDEVGRESGKPYISWSNSVVPAMPDVDGRIVLRAFQITYDDQ